jgi:hypothetical protein
MPPGRCDRTHRHRIRLHDPHGDADAGNMAPPLHGRVQPECFDADNFGWEICTEGRGKEAGGLQPIGAFVRTKKKEEFPRLMDNMTPGNSFPQICVVSVNQSVENSRFRQEYRRTMNVSNQAYWRLSYHLYRYSASAQFCGSLIRKSRRRSETSSGPASRARCGSPHPPCA